MAVLEALTLEAIKARYRKSPKGYHYQPPAETMWADARALIVIVEDLERALRLLRAHTDGCERCQQVADHDRDKAAENR